jgi:hypothetical protein
LYLDDYYIIGIAMNNNLMLVATDGVTLNMLAELVYDVEENRNVRNRFPDVHLRALEDFCFTLYWAGGVVLDKNIWESLKNHDFIELISKASNNTAILHLPNDMPSLTEIVNDTTVRKGIEDHLIVLDRAIEDQPVFWRQFTQSDYAKHGKVIHKGIFEEDPSVIRFMKPYLSNSELMGKIPSKAIKHGVEFLRESQPQNEETDKILAEYIKRSYLTHISIGWNYSLHYAINNVAYMPAPTRVSAWFSSSKTRLQKNQTILKNLYLPYFLERLLRKFPNYRVQPEEFVKILIDFCLDPQEIDRKAQKLFRDLIQNENENDFKKEADKIATSIERIRAGQPRDQFSIGLSTPVSILCQGEPPVLWQKINPRWWMRDFFRHDSQDFDNEISKKLRRLFPSTFNDY